jgi:hypothetical protein
MHLHPIIAEQWRPTSGGGIGFPRLSFVFEAPWGKSAVRQSGTGRRCDDNVTTLGLDDISREPMSA